MMCVFFFVEEHTTKFIVPHFLFSAADAALLCFLFLFAFFFTERHRGSRVKWMKIFSRCEVKGMFMKTLENEWIEGVEGAQKSNKIKKFKAACHPPPSSTYVCKRKNIESSRTSRQKILKNMKKLKEN